MAYRLFRNISCWDVHIVRPDEGSKDKLYDRDMKISLFGDQKKKIDRTWWTPEAKSNEQFTKFVDNLVTQNDRLEH